MKRTAVVCTLLLACLAGRAAAEDAAKLKVLWTTGGCCHDYKKNAPLLTEKMAQYANAEFKIVFGMTIFKDKDFAKGFDAVVYDLCEAGVKDKELIGNIVATIREGKPAVIVHCSLHTFRVPEGEEWREAMGLSSASHDKFRELSTKKVADHPTTRFWPADWKTPGEELYRNIKVWPNATALMTAYSVESKKDHVVTWVNQFGKAKVFATTLGHNMLTVGQDEYHHLLANGLLWVCGKLDDQGKPLPGFEGTKK